MKLYEVVWEIFNKCPNNQMRDVFIEEVEIEDTDAYVIAKIKDKDLSYEKTELKDGTLIYDLLASGIKERISFTEI